MRHTTTSGEQPIASGRQSAGNNRTPRLRRFFLCAIVVASAGAGVQAEETGRFDSCDVTWLWPVPEDESAVARLIDADELRSADGQALWSDDAFEDFMATADSDAASVKVSESVTRRVRFDDAFRQRSAWKLTGVRIDPCAPGGHRNISSVFGEAPQIRLVLQPLVVTEGSVKVHDTTAHLVYSFVSGRDGIRNTPDREDFQEVASDLMTLKARSLELGAPTEGAPLGVHPGLLGGNAAAFGEELHQFLQRSLTPARLTAMAMMGLAPDPEPWVFVGMFRPAPGARFTALPIPVFRAADPTRAVTAQMLSFRDQPRVLPVPRTSNLGLSPNGGGPRGVSTAPLFDTNASDQLDDKAAVGIDNTGDVLRDDSLTNRDLPDHVANPERSHFFNTDCVSCHTESQRRAKFRLGPGRSAFEWPEGVSPLADDVGQTQRWNVRNLGWFPDFFAGGDAKPTISQRTGNETAESVSFMNAHYRQTDE